MISKSWLSVRPRSQSNEQPMGLHVQAGLVFGEARAKKEVRPVNKDLSGITEDSERLLSRQSFSKTRPEVERPKTAAGILQSRSSLDRPSETTRTKTRGPDNAVLIEPGSATNIVPGEDAVTGLPLSSPSHVPQSHFGVLVHPLLATTEVGGHLGYEGDSDERMKGVKESKWKKFGGLFKGKGSASTHPPFCPPRSTLTSASTRLDELPPNQRAPTPASKNDPETEESGVNDTSQHSGRSVSPGIVLPAQLPKLTVSIPDVKMDRYSVMFGTVLGNQQSTSSLARRSRPLERPKAADEPGLSSIEEAPLLPTNSLTKSRASPQPQIRRATSPSATKSPIFSLFPQPASTVRAAPGKMPQVKESPLRRSYTAPCLSPTKESFHFQPTLPQTNGHTTNRKSLDGPEQDFTFATQEIDWPADGLCQSPVTSNSSTHEEEILFHFKKLSVDADHRESQYEVATPDGAAVELYRSRSQKVKAAKRSKTRELGSSAANDMAKPHGKLDGQIGKSLSTLVPGPGLDTKDVGATPLPMIEAVVPNRPREVKPSPLRMRPDDNMLLTLNKVSRKPKPYANVPDLQPVNLAPSVETLEPPPATTQDMLAAAVEETLLQMEAQSGSRAASPMGDLPAHIRPPSPPDKGVKPVPASNNMLISKYSTRSLAPPPAPKTPSQAEELMRKAARITAREKSYAVRAARQRAAAVALEDLVDTTTSTKTIEEDPQTALSASPRPQLRSKFHVKIPVVTKLNETHEHQMHGSDDSSLPNRPSAEIAIARKVSLTRKPSRRVLLPPAAPATSAPATDPSTSKAASALPPAAIVPRFSNRGLGFQASYDQDLKWNVNNSQVCSPTIVEAHRAHRPGKSFGALIEMV